MSGIYGTEGILQVVMLGLGQDIFAIGASMVREIIDPVPTTRVAGARPHLASVINVRGNVIPLADIRPRFGIAQPPATPDTRILVLELAIDGDPVVVGVLADRVFEVTDIDLASLQPTQTVGTAWRPEYIRGFAKWNGNFVVVPDLQRILH